MQGTLTAQIVSCMGGAGIGAVCADVGGVDVGMGVARASVLALT